MTVSTGGTFVSVDFTADPEALEDAAVEALRAAFPGWEPADASLEVILIQAIALANATTTAVAANVPPAIFRKFGQQILSVFPIDGAQATTTTSWTARDTAGYTAPAGTLVGYRVTGDDLRVFQATAPVVILPGQSSVSGVTLSALDVGTVNNGIPSAAALELVDALSWVSTVATTSVSAGGVDPETDAAYLDRLAAELRLMAPRPVLPADFAVLAQQVTGVTRALAINGYNPGDATSNNERYVCLVPLDSTGAAVSSGVRANVVSYLDALREVSFIVAATTPTFTTVNVAYSVHVASGYTGADVIARATAAVQAFLSPATWAGGDQSPPVWRTGEDKVRFGALMAALYRVDGVAYVASLTINGSGADLTLTGVAPLPSVGTVTGSTV